MGSLNFGIMNYKSKFEGEFNFLLEVVQILFKNDKIFVNIFIQIVFQILKVSKLYKK